MTRFEYIKTLDPKELSHYLCYQFKGCGTCPVEHRCGLGNSWKNGWLDFLEREITPQEAAQIKPL